MLLEEGYGGSAYTDMYSNLVIFILSSFCYKKVQPPTIRMTVYKVLKI
jgi:hypothetical protein